MIIDIPGGQSGNLYLVKLTGRASLLFELNFASGKEESPNLSARWERQ